MADTTAISITAIVAGAIGAIGGPVIAAWGQRKGNRERFTHEREMRDTGDVRGLLTDGAEILDAIAVEMAKLRWIFMREGAIGPGVDEYRDVLQPLADKLSEFRRKAASIEISAGPDDGLSRTCRDVTEHVSTVASRVQLCLSLNEVKPEDVEVIYDEGKVLADHRDAYVKAAHEAAGFRLGR